jgi:hypothetical protein
VRQLQNEKSPSGIFVSCDGVLNVTDDNFLHRRKAEFPRAETEEGKMKEVRLSQRQNA